jgi:hypothetical protein
MGQKSHVMGCLIGFPPNMTKSTGPETILLTNDSPNNVTHINSRDLNFTLQNTDDRGVITLELNIAKIMLDGHADGVVQSGRFS